MINKKLTLIACTFFSQTISAATPPAFVEMQTNLGTIAIQLDYVHAPITANNFINYVTSGFYNKTLIHRVIKDFVVQGGGFNLKDAKPKPTNPPITLESNNSLSNLTGTIAMARTTDPNSATSQFFINVNDNIGLNYVSATSPGYAVFGKVIKGLNVATAIENLATFVLPGSTSPALPFTAASDLVFIDRTYASAGYNTNLSITRVSLDGAGSIASSPAGINCGTKCSMSTNLGAPLNLTAAPKTGYAFSGWRGDCHGILPTISLNTTKGNHNCTASFVRASSAPQ